MNILVGSGLIQSNWSRLVLNIENRWRRETCRQQNPKQQKLKHFERLTRYCKSSRSYDSNWAITVLTSASISGAYISILYINIYVYILIFIPTTMKSFVKLIHTFGLPLIVSWIPIGNVVINCWNISINSANERSDGFSFLTNKLNDSLFQTFDAIDFVRKNLLWQWWIMCIYKRHDYHILGFR